MELRAGYKQTEVGVIPEDWNLQKLGDFAAFKTGPFGSALHKSDYIEGGIPVVNPMQIIDGKLIPTSSMAISDAAARKLSDFRLSEGEIVIGRRGDMGRCAVVGSGESGWLCGTGSMIVRCKPSLNSGFAQRLLSSPAIVAEIENTSVGTTMINLNQGTLRNLLIPLPPSFEEQQAIAATLSDADALIEALEQLLAKKRQIKQGAMQELLTGQRRLPGFAGEWKKRFLNEICWFQEGPGVRAWQFTESGVKLLNGTNIYRGALYLDSTSRFISEREAYGPYAHFMADVGDIVIASSGITIDKFHEKVAYVEQDDLPFCMNTSTIRFKPKQEILASEFLFHSLTSDGFKRQIGGQATGSAQLNFGPSHVTKVSIALPGYVEQTAIATVLSDMDAEITTLEAKLAKARSVKQGMMQELLTGRIRLV